VTPDAPGPVSRADRRSSACRIIATGRKCAAVLLSALPLAACVAGLKPCRHVLLTDPPDVAVMLVPTQMVVQPLHKGLVRRPENPAISRSLNAQRDSPAIAKVSTANELTDALTKGGVIQLVPGTYIGNFIISVPGTELRGARLPLARVIADQTAGYVLKPQDPLTPALRILASRFRMIGIRVVNGDPSRSTVVAGSPTATDPAAQPDDVELDRVEIVAASGLGKRGIEAHTRSFTLARSRVVGFLYRGQDSQAFLTYNGPGPYTLVDNELSASGENIMTGGGSIKSAAMIPSQVVIRGNLILKPQEWRTTTGSVKNSVEFKAVKGALVEDNVIDGCWRDAQAGHMIVITPRNQYNDSPWTVVQDVVIRGNKTVRHTDGYAVNVLGTDNNAPTQPTARITIERNLFQDSPKGILVSYGVTGYLRVLNNTLPGVRWNLLTFTSTTVKTPLTFTGNVAKSGEYGINGDDTAPGSPTLSAHAILEAFTGNVIEKTPARRIEWPSGNTLVDPGGLAALLDGQFRYRAGGAGYSVDAQRHID
jgi:hypothetical protein